MNEPHDVQLDDLQQLMFDHFTLVDSWPGGSLPSLTSVALKVHNQQFRLDIDGNPEETLWTRQMLAKALASLVATVVSKHHDLAMAAAARAAMEAYAQDLKAHGFGPEKP